MGRNGIKTAAYYFSPLRRTNLSDFGLGIWDFENRTELGAGNCHPSNLKYIYIFNLPYLTIDIGFNLKDLNNVQLPDVPSLGKEGRGRLMNLSAPHGLTELVKVLPKWSNLSKDGG